MIEAIRTEIDLRSEYLSHKHLSSIYFGGGTPSLLNKEDLEKVFDSLSKYFTWDSSTEITLEANPDDLSNENLKDLYDLNVNRLSIGVQSFDAEDLAFMNRAHNAEEAEKSIKLAQDVGFDNITADLIYGSPTTSQKTWENNISKMLSFDIPHISSYCLTVEPGTALQHFVSVGKAKPVDETKANEQFEFLIHTLNSHGYEHYEISNFAKPDSLAVHNTNYWMGEPYLGIGPSAHSYNGKNERSWNIAHNAKYMRKLKEGIIPNETESLSEKDQFNEYILIRMRTKWGINMNQVQNEFEAFTAEFTQKLNRQIDLGLVTPKEGAYVLTSKGKHLADRVSMELFAD